MNFPANMCGFQRISASGIVGDSGKPILIAGYAIDSTSGGVTTATFRNGAGSGAAVAFLSQTVTAASQSYTQSIPMPVMLPNGCYVSFDANTSAITVFYIQAT